MAADVEVTLARHTAARAVVIGPLLVALFGILRGPGGAVASAVGVVIVAGYFLLSGAMLAVAARISLAAYHAAALLGFTPRALQAWRQNGQGPAFVRVSARAIRYRRKDLTAWAQKRLRRTT